MFESRKGSLPAVLVKYGNLCHPFIVVRHEVLRKQKLIQKSVLHVGKSCTVASMVEQYYHKQHVSVLKNTLYKTTCSSISRKVTNKVQNII
jgi:hypothetical protein